MASFFKSFRKDKHADEKSLKAGGIKEKRMKGKSPQAKESKVSTMIVAAIDFGTTYSGTAFAFKHELDKDPTKVLAIHWNGDKLVSLKAPTCALIENDGETLAGFGYDAEKKYEQFTAEGTHEDWYYFRHFKMLLYGEKVKDKEFNEGTMLEDFAGRRLSAMKVFTLCIQFLKDTLRKEADQKITGAITDDDIRWVITVPAIWNDNAKQFMRRAAENAGIDGTRLNIALEPEAASLHCRNIQVVKDEGNDGHTLNSFKPGSTYLVLDAGGGTVDITVHETTTTGGVKEIHQASGGDWGGTSVDRAFLDMLENILGNDTMVHFKKNFMEDYNDLVMEFETKKRNITSDMTTNVTIKIPYDLTKAHDDITGRTIQSSLQSSPFEGKITIAGDKIRIHPVIARGFFEQSIRSIISHVKGLLEVKAVSGCKTIMLVGGYSDSGILQDAVRNAFPTLKLIIPDEAGIAVLKGAVAYGNIPTAISERVCKYTYGTATTHEKDEYCTHPPCKTFSGENGILMCNDIFDVHIKRGHAVKVGDKQEELLYRTMYKYQEYFMIIVYTSLEENPSLVTDEGCRAIGQFTVPVTGGIKGEIGISFVFGGTEIEVIAVDKRSRKITKHKVDFVG